MLTTEQIETVLVSPESDPTGHERIVVAFRSGDDLFVPLDIERPANADLLDHGRLYVRRTDSVDTYIVYDVVGHSEISLPDRRRLEAEVHKPISATTEVLHLVGSQHLIEQDEAVVPGYVVVADASERSQCALAPAAQLAGWYRKPLTVVAVADDPENVRQSLGKAFSEASVSESAVSYLARADLDVCLLDLMRQGHIVIAAAFGVWTHDGYLHGLLNGLVRHNAPAVIGIGPNVNPDWAPTSQRPILICVDSSEHADDFVGRIGPWITQQQSKVLVVHVTTEVPPDKSVALNIAGRLHQRYGLPVEAKHVRGTNTAETIGTIASTVNAQLIVVNSWHRPPAEGSSVASTSLTSVAHATCPVVILSAP